MLMLILKDVAQPQDILGNLNTSHVNVNLLFSVLHQPSPIAFKYISC